jgi:sulfate/thiosulfate-binding protein
MLRTVGLRAFAFAFALPLPLLVRRLRLSLVLLLVALGASPLPVHADSAGAGRTLLNVSYDPTRELYREFNAAFARHWKARTGETVTVQQSHGGSGSQSRAVAAGVQADVVTLALSGDIDALSERGLVARDWQGRNAHRSAPYTSTIVFLVRKGNPKHIRDWSDLVRPGVSIVTPNPKSSGGGRWNYLAAWAYALRQPDANDASARAFMARLYRNVAVLDPGARAATTRFVERGVGDVLIAWENEAMLAIRELGPNRVEMVAPLVSILAEPPVAVVDKVADKRGTRRLAEAYLAYLYSEEGQLIVAKHYYRPTVTSFARKYASSFPRIKLFTIDEVAGGWDAAQQAHFADGGIFDQVARASSK